MKMPRGVTIKSMRRGPKGLTLDLVVDRAEVIAGWLERGVWVDHGGHEHRVVSVDPPRLGRALRKRT